MKDYYAEAERLRRLAGQMQSGDMRSLALQIAAVYERMAHQAEILATVGNNDGGAGYEKLLKRDL